MSDAWYYADNSAPTGPLTLQELKAKFRTNPNWRETLVWCEGFADWRPAGSIQELAVTPPPLPTSFSPSNAATAAAMTAATAAPLEVKKPQTTAKIKPLRFLFSFRGRHNRAKFWLVTLISIIWMPTSAFFITGAEAQHSDALVFVAFLWLLIGFWICSANYVKRLHDLNASGWWSIFLIGFGPSLAELAKHVGPNAANILAGLGMLFGFSTLAILGAVEGTVGDNRFGPDRVQRSDESVTAAPGSRDSP